MGGMVQPTGEVNECGPGPRGTPPTSPLSQFSTSHWAAEMSSCTDGPSKSQTMQDSGDALLETVNPSDSEEKRKSRGPRGSGTAASGTRHRNICSENLLFRVKSIMLSEHVLLLLEQRAPDRRKALAGGKVNRHSLLYSGHFIHLVGLIKRQMLFLDI